MKGKERKGKERKGKERKGKERKGKESFSCRNLISCKAALQRLFCEKRYTNNLELTGKERKRKSKEVRKTRTRKGKGMEIGQEKIQIMKQNIISYMSTVEDTRTKSMFITDFGKHNN